MATMRKKKVWIDKSEPVDRIETYPSGSHYTSDVLICYGSRLPIKQIDGVCPMTLAFWTAKEEKKYPFEFELLKPRLLIGPQPSLSCQPVIRITTKHYSPLEVKSIYSQCFHHVLFAKPSRNASSTFNTKQYPSFPNHTQTIADTQNRINRNEYYPLHRHKPSNSSVSHHPKRRPSPPSTPPPPQSLYNAPKQSMMDSPPLPLSHVTRGAEPAHHREEEKHMMQHPRFDFGSMEDDIIFDFDEFELSDTHSSDEYYNVSPNQKGWDTPPAPLTINNNNNNNPRAPQPPLSDAHPPLMNQPEPQRNPNKKAERTDAPILNDIFGVTDSHDGYQEYHKAARITYSEKLKAAPKIEKNPKNYFLLPILTDWEHIIGTKIGKRDYGFHSDAGLNSKSKSRDSNKHHGADFEIPEKEDKCNEQSKKAISVVLEVMQAKKYKNHDFKYQDLGRGPRGFGWQFILKGQRVAEGFAKGRKNDAKTQCARNAIHRFKSDPEFRELSPLVSRIELGIRAGGKKDAAPVGFEYPVVLSYRRNARKYRYESVQCDVRSTVQLERKNEDYHYGASYQLEIYKDRGLFGDEVRDNPSVEELYIERWTTFKGKRNTPIHCHEYLDRAGYFIKRFTSVKEEKIWKAIWKVYRWKKEGDKQENNNNNNNDRNYNNMNEQKEEKYEAPVPPHVQAQNKYPDEIQSRVSVPAPPVQSAQNEPVIYPYSESDTEDTFEDVKVQENEANTTPFTHCLMYDFDGTVYADRLCHRMRKKGITDPQKQLEYINNLAVNNIDKVTQGFGGLERIEALKQHFKALKAYKDRLCLALYTYHELKAIEVLFNAVQMDHHPFNVIVGSDHIVQIQINDDKITELDHDRRHRKDRMVSIFCDKYKISTKNVLFMDDSRKIKEEVQCCEVFEVKNRGKGLSADEMSDIVTYVQRQWYPLKQESESNEKNDLNEEQKVNDNQKMDTDMNVNEKEDTVPLANWKVNEKEIQFVMQLCIMCEISFNNRFKDQIPICKRCRNEDLNAHFQNFEVKSQPSRANFR